jgi:hypothetical protein
MLPPRAVNGPADVTELAQIDPARRRIYLLFEGFLTLDNALKLKDAYERAITSVGRGFTVLSYFKDFTPATTQVADVFTSMIALASQGGCRKAARVSSGSVLGPLQMSRLATSRAGYASRQFDTWAEAEDYLDSDQD